METNNDTLRHHHSLMEVIHSYYKGSDRCLVLTDNGKPHCAGKLKPGPWLPHFKFCSWFVHFSERVLNADNVSKVSDEFIRWDK
jgi:hypothetical protein